MTTAIDRYGVNDLWIYLLAVSRSNVTLLRLRKMPEIPQLSPQNAYTCSWGLRIRTLSTCTVILRINIWSYLVNLLLLTHGFNIPGVNMHPDWWYLVWEWVLTKSSSHWPLLGAEFQQTQAPISRYWKGSDTSVYAKWDTAQTIQILFIIHIK